LELPDGSLELMEDLEPEGGAASLELPAGSLELTKDLEPEQGAASSVFMDESLKLIRDVDLEGGAASQKCPEEMLTYSETQHVAEQLSLELFGSFDGEEELAGDSLLLGPALHEVKDDLLEELPEVLFSQKIDDIPSPEYIDASIFGTQDHAQPAECKLSADVATVEGVLV